MKVYKILHLPSSKYLTAKYAISASQGLVRIDGVVENGYEEIELGFKTDGNFKQAMGIIQEDEIELVLRFANRTRARIALNVMMDTMKTDHEDKLFEEDKYLLEYKDKDIDFSNVVNRKDFEIIEEEI